MFESPSETLKAGRGSLASQGNARDDLRKMVNLPGTVAREGFGDNFVEHPHVDVVEELGEELDCEGGVHSAPP